MNLLLTAVAGSAATHVFDNTFPNVYKKSNDLLGVNLFSVDEKEDENIVDDDEKDYIIDPDVGYLPKPKEEIKKLGYSLRGKGGPPKIPVEEKKEEPIKEEPVVEISYDCDLQLLDYIAYLSVTAFVLYSSYKMLELARKSQYNIYE